MRCFRHQMKGDDFISRKTGYIILDCSETKSPFWPIPALQAIRFGSKSSYFQAYLNYGICQRCRKIKIDFGTHTEMFKTWEAFRLQYPFFADQINWERVIG